MSAGTRIDKRQLPPQAHLCGTFQAPGERDRAMGAFFRTGLAAGEHCMIAVDTAEPDDILAAIGSPAEVAGWERGRAPDGPHGARRRTSPARPHLPPGDGRLERGDRDGPVHPRAPGR